MIMRALVPTLVVGVLIAGAFQFLALGAVAEGEGDAERNWGVQTRMGILRDLEERSAKNGQAITRSNAETPTFTYTDGPYPIPNDDGSFSGPGPMAWGDHYVSDVMVKPPNNPGGGYSMDHTSSAGYMTVGNTHETYVGNVNGNQFIEWVTYYSYIPWGKDGLDNDGDGCIDEKTHGDWDGQSGCDNIPDQFVYFETGGLPDVGGKDGTLVVLLDWWSGNPNSIKIFRIHTSQAWDAYDLNVLGFYPEVVDNEDIISYYAHEADNLVNANPEMDSDMEDWYLASIDARGFPLETPSNHVCFAGYATYKGRTSLHDDGSVVTSFELREWQDGADWNGDGDQTDPVAAYYVVDPVTGDCDQGVNGGVYGQVPRNSGKVMIGGYTRESNDSRDWNGDGDMTDAPMVWHDINSTWHLVGHRYTSTTFTSAPGQFGFGFWGVFTNDGHWVGFPLRFGGVFAEFVDALPGYYRAHFFLTDDEDGDSQTELPRYFITYGIPGGALAGTCIMLYSREDHLENAGVKLIGGQADGNGDGDTSDTLNSVYCPNSSSGGGKFIVEPTSKYAKGLYQDPIPFICAGYFYFDSGSGDDKGLINMPIFFNEMELDDDADGNLLVEDYYYHANYVFLIPEARMRFIQQDFLFASTPGYMRDIDGEDDSALFSGETVFSSFHSDAGLLPTPVHLTEMRVKERISRTTSSPI
jgi:hypothetical protein